MKSPNHRDTASTEKPTKAQGANPKLDLPTFGGRWTKLFQAAASNDSGLT